MPRVVHCSVPRAQVSCDLIYRVVCTSPCVSVIR